MATESDLKSRTVLTPTEARQGETTGHVRIILAVSLLLALVAGVGFLIFYGS